MRLCLRRRDISLGGGERRVHCGCIVLAQSYMLLDAGGIECIVCARKALSMAPNNMWSPSMLISSQVSEGPKELPVKSWGQVTGSFPGQWWQGPHLWSTGIQSDLQQRLSYEFDRPLHTDRLIAGVHASMSAQDKKVGEMSERLASSNLNHVSRNGTTALDSALAFSMHREEGNNLQDSCHHLGNSDCLTGFARVNFEAHPISSGKNTFKGRVITFTCWLGY